MLDIDKIAIEAIEERIKIPISQISTGNETMFVSSAVMATVKALSVLQKEYEEKLRWIPVEEKLPENYPELFLKKSMSKNVLIKRKWLDTGEIVIEINSRFMPSERIGFLWNYDYPNSEIIEWRSFL